jgi:hypothetical protein
MRLTNWSEKSPASAGLSFGLALITEQIVTALAVSLTGDEQDQQACHATEHPQAHDAYLQGWSHYNLTTPAALAQALTFLEEAVQLDPGYAQAHVALASLYWDAYVTTQSMTRWTRPSSPAFHTEWMRVLLISHISPSPMLMASPPTAKTQRSFDTMGT